MDFGIETRGFDKLLKTFSNLPRSMRRKALRPALRKGANIVKKAASENVQAVTSDEATGLLSRSLETRSAKPFRGSLRMLVRIKANVFSEKGTRVGLYGSVLEYGKENQPPRSWMRKAARENTSEVLEAVRAEVQTRIPEVIKDAQ